MKRIKRMKPMVVVVFLVLFIILLIPTLLVIPFQDKLDGKLSESLEQKRVIEEGKSVKVVAPETVEVSVYRSKEKKLEKMPLEQYVIGVVAAEMPAEFELEALKAQALTARTYIVKQMLNPALNLPDGANVTDTVMNQVYDNDTELKTKWGKDYTWKLEKITKAVEETAGRILTFQHTPIEASFFSTSNGYTENSEAYWQSAYPYLTSVSSKWDKDSPKFYDKKTMSVTEFEKKLGVTLSKDGSLGKVIARTPGKRVDTIEINGKKLKGKTVRERLELRSTDFSWIKTGENILITTKGYGHGVGMSQYGANFMAQSGKTYEEIVKYYYKGIQLEEAKPFLQKLMVKGN